MKLFPSLLIVGAITMGLSGSNVASAYPGKAYPWQIPSQNPAQNPSQYPGKFKGIPEKVVGAPKKVGSPKTVAKAPQTGVPFTVQKGKVSSVVKGIPSQKGVTFQKGVVGKSFQKGWPKGYSKGGPSQCPSQNPGQNPGQAPFLRSH